MNLIELHILQSFPVTCLNRDDVGSPKSATFGGAPRARLSSQCLKRAVREKAREMSGNGTFGGIRSRLLREPFRNAFLASGMSEKEADDKATELCQTFSTLDKKDEKQVTTAVYLSPAEIDEISRAVAAGEDPKKAAKKAQRLDAADIALFGRMVANDASLNIEGASMFSHALSTHKAANEVDFFSAVDDRKCGAEDAGAGMIGTLEYNSATYYRYTGINLDLFAAKTHLGGLSSQERRNVLRTFLEATLVAVPGARRNSMNGSTLPHTVLGIRKSSGQPLQLVNAFETPVSSNGVGLLARSEENLRVHHDRMKNIWGVRTDVEVWLGEDTPLPSFLDQLLESDV